MVAEQLECWSRTCRVRGVILATSSVCCEFANSPSVYVGLPGFIRNMEKAWNLIVVFSKFGGKKERKYGNISVFPDKCDKVTYYV